MLKLTASYGKKLPVEGADFSSQNYHAAVEVELPAGLSREELDRRIRETFELVRASVEAELGASSRSGSTARSFRPPSKPRNSQARPASAKQLAYLRDIATRSGMSPAELVEEAAARFGVESLEQLSRENASALIDILQGGGASSRPPRRAAA